MEHAPTVGETLQVDQLDAYSKKMNVFDMTPVAIEALKRGKTVRIFVSSNKGPQFLTRATLRGLCAFVPVVAKALKDHNSSQRGTIDDITLPAHLMAAYKRVMGWMVSCMKEGKITQFAKYYRRDALRIYKDVEQLAGVFLRMSYLSKGMKNRIEAMTRSASGYICIKRAG